MSDKLERAFRALRDEATGTSAQAEVTLEKVLTRRRGLRAVWLKRMRTWVPIAAVLVIAGSALARSGGGAWLRARTGGASEGMVQSSAPASSAVPVEAPSAAAVEATGAVLPEPVPSVRVVPSVAAATSMAAASSPAPSPAPAPRSQASAAAPLLSPASSRPLEAEPALSGGPSEADVYARAHRLHFDGGDPRAALGAWDDYLARYPAGRFAPDARFNRAIDLLKMKRTDEARAALQPFADGAFGGYHREDARTLLQSIR